MMKETFDIAIIGAGPGGYVSAIRASQLGLRVCLIEKDTLGLGGTCLNRGCIPTKILAGGANLLEDIKDAGWFGIKAGDISFDYKKLKIHKDTVVKELRQGIEFLLKKNKVRVKYGFGRVTDKNSIEIENKSAREKIGARYIILATGSDPAQFPGRSKDEIDSKKIIDTTAALDLDELPKSIIILGGSVSGCEFASIYNSFGVDVTIFEMLDSILNIKNSEKEIIDALHSSFTRRGIKIVCGAKVISVETKRDMVSVDFEKGGIKKSKDADMVLIATGRKLCTDNLNLEAVGIKIGSQGEVAVDKDLRTCSGTIYAIGDISGSPMLAHSAYAQAKAVCSQITGQKPAFDLTTIPCCIFTNPPISMVGLSEEEALKTRDTVKTGTFPLEALGIARAIDRTEGFVKLISDKKGYILGGHIIGYHATELIQEITLAISNKMTVKDITTIIHPHPTFSEALLEAGEDLLDEAIHI